MTATSPAPEDILRLAHAVVRADGNALLIDQDNASTGQWMPVADAVASGSAFTVEIKRALVALDLDTPELIGIGDTIRQTFTMPTLLVGSGRNQHLYIFAGHHRDAVVQRVREMGIPAGAVRRAIRPPLSPHRLGMPVRLIEPSTVEEALEVLGAPEEPTYLPDWVIDLIEHGDTTGRFSGNRSNMAITIASAMKRANMTLPQFQAVMGNRTNLGASKAHELEDRGMDVDTWIVRTWDRAEVSGFDPGVISRTRAKVLSAPWQGRAGKTDKAVMIALCDLATTHATTTPTFGVRRIAEVAQLGTEKTVRRALARLTEDGWLHRIPASSSGLADGYRLQGGSITTALDTRGDGNRCGHYAPPSDDHLGNHPVFRDGSGLGKSRGSLWMALSSANGPMTRQRLAEAAACSTATVRRGMSVLVEHGLAERTDTGWVAVGDVDTLDSVAVQIGAMERALRQIEEHEKHREGFKTARFLQGRRAESGLQDASLIDVVEALDDTIDMDDYERRLREELGV